MGICISKKTKTPFVVQNISEKWMINEDILTSITHNTVNGKLCIEQKHFHLRNYKNVKTLLNDIERYFQFIYGEERGKDIIEQCYFLDIQSIVMLTFISSEIIQLQMKYKDVKVPQLLKYRSNTKNADKILTLDEIDEIVTIKGNIVVIELVSDIEHWVTYFNLSDVGNNVVCIRQ